MPLLRALLSASRPARAPRAALRCLSSGWWQHGAVGPCHTPPSPYDFLPDAPTFSLTSADVAEGGTLSEPQLSGAFEVPGGEDRSPELSWSGFPEDTKSFVVSCFDPDAPTVPACPSHPAPPPAAGRADS